MITSRIHANIVTSNAQLVSIINVLCHGPALKAFKKVKTQPNAAQNRMYEFLGLLPDFTYS
jgi:hypothetical protein